jgi:hypothetical protein
MNVSSRPWTLPIPTKSPATAGEDDPRAGVFGDLAPELPVSQLAILPGTTHVGMLERTGWMASMVTTFLAT